MAIKYYTKDCTFDFRGKRKIILWITGAIHAEGGRVGDIAINFCSDYYVLEINRQYLRHDYFTDIITFDYTDGEVISGDLMISVDTVKDNAERFGVTFREEMLRVIIHGILHLLGHPDKTEAEAGEMRKLEDKYLKLYAELP